MDGRAPDSRRLSRRWRHRPLFAFLLVLPMASFTAEQRPLDDVDRTPTSRPLASDVVMRVRLMRDVNEVVLNADSGVLVDTLRGRGRDGRVFQSPVRVRLVGSGLNVRGADGRSRTYSATSPLRLEAMSGRIRLGDAEYPGFMAIEAREDEKTFDLIEHVNLEEYLPGVLSRELYPNWSLTTYSAQAIAARSYAIQERERRIAIGSSFDVESTTQDQAYGGSDASDKAKLAVAQTRGKVLTYQGAVLRAYYSSTCGGRPGSARDTWPIGRGFEFNLAAPIQGVPHECPCDFSPRYRWTVERSSTVLARRMRAFGADQGMAIRSIRSLHSIEPERHNAAQRPATYRITDAEGATWRMSAEELRLAMNHNGSSGLGRPEAADTVWSGDVSVEIKGERVIITGRGFGHGVGMCQFGAEGLSRTGKSPEEILAVYYPGAELSRMF